MIEIPNIIEKFGKFGRGRIIALDIEHTGGKKEVRKIIQMGIVAYINGEVKEHTKLFGGGKSDYYAFKVHGITDESRDGCPPFEESCEKLAKYLSGSTIIGHNAAACDMKIIGSYMDKTGFKIENYRLIDTYRLAIDILSSGNRKLEDCCAEFGIEFGAHDALGDARSCLLLLEELVKKKKDMEPEFFIYK
nr:MAG TPA: DNA polymerase III subunit alpha [Caudoviricetes sp.]